MATRTTAEFTSRRRLIGSLAVMLTLAAAPPLAAQPIDGSQDMLRLLVGRWLAEEINGRDVDEVARSILVIDVDGRLSGTGGCNRFHGAVSIKRAQIHFSSRSMITTLKACSPDFSSQDRRFHEALERARSFSLRPLEQKLILLDRTDKPLMRLVRM